MDYVPPRRSDGTRQTRRIPQAWPTGRRFRILSIDGGGICGILPAAILTELERRYLNSAPIGHYFDLIAGTSTGGIIALALGHGMAAEEILNVYMEKGGVIFPPTNIFGRYYRLACRGFRSGYERAPLEMELMKIFGSSVLGEATTRLCIPAFEGRHGEPWIYKTPHHPDYKLDRYERMVKIAMSTAAAPTFFDALSNNGYVMVDGGIWANNPIMNALVDALACFDLDRSQIDILSLGCGETSFTVDSRRAKGGFFRWANVFSAATRAQSLNAIGQAYLLVGKDHVVRLDAPASNNPIKLDDYLRAKNELPGMARALVEGAGSEIKRTFLSDKADSYRSYFD